MTDNAHDRRTLEERLQWIADWSEPGIDLADAGTAREALDRIKSQAIRIRELEAERQRLITENNVLTNERDALKAEVARLRGALMNIESLWISNNSEGDDYDEGYDDGVKDACDIARAALAGGSHD